MKRNINIFLLEKKSVLSGVMKIFVHYSEERLYCATCYIVAAFVQETSYLV